MKNFKKLLAVTLAFLHLTTFSANVFAQEQVITLQDGSVNAFDSIDVAVDDTLTINIVDALGDVCPSCRSILEGNSFINNGNVGIFGILALIAPQIVNNGVINVTGDLLLSNLGIDHDAFFAGMAALAADPASNPGSILNTGEINNLTQGLIALVAGSGGVHNLGTITADGGAVALVAGNQVSFPLTKNGFLNIQIDDGVSVKGDVYDSEGNLVETDGLITNSGVISANGGVAVLQAEGAEAAFDSIINHTGIIQAQTIEEVNGVIVLKGGDEGVVSVSGELDATGDASELGGHIEVLGNKVGLFEGALVDASGGIGGGEVLIGGDYQGQGETPTAEFTYIDKEAKVFVSATQNGDGGRLIVWSDDATRAYGTLEAEGGAQGGDGGFIEVSGKEYLDFAGANISAAAVLGDAGTVLFDPRNLTVVAAGTAAPDAPEAGGIFTPGADDSEVVVTDINAILDTGSNVELNTGATGAQDGDISVEAVITKSAGGDSNLLITAARRAEIQATGGISNTSGGKLNVTINGDNDLNNSGRVRIHGNVTTGGGTLDLISGGQVAIHSGAVVNTGGGAVNIDADINNDGSGTFDMQGGSSLISGGANIDILGENLAIASSGGGTINAGAGTVLLEDSEAGETLDLGSGVAGGFDIDDAEADNITATQLTIGNATTGNVTAGDFSPANVTTLSIITGGSVAEDAADAGADITVTNLSVQSATGVDVDVDVTDIAVNNSGAGGIDVTDTTGGLTVGTVNGVVGASTAGGGVALTANSPLTINSAVTDTTGGDITLTASGATPADILTLNADVTTTGNGIFTSGGATTQTGGKVDVAGLSVTSGGAVTLNSATNDVTTLAVSAAGQSVGFTDVNAVEIGTVGAVNGVTSDSLNLNAGGAVTDSNGATIAVTNAATINAGANDITLGDNGGDTTNFGTLNVTGGSVTVTEDSAMDLAGASATTLSVTTSAGDITDSGTLTATNLEFESAGLVDLDDANNDFDNVAGTSNGTLEINDKDDLTVATVGTHNGLISNGNLIDLDTAGALTINQQINAAAGNVDIDADGAVTAVDDAAADIVGATIDITATAIGASAVDVTATTALNANTSGSNGKIEIDSIGNLPLGTVNAGTGNVTIESTGNITDANDGGTPDAPHVNNVTGADITLNTTGGDIGTTGNKVEIDPSNSWSSATNGGALNIHCMGNCPLGQIDVGTATFTFSSVGQITDTNDAVSGEHNGGVWNITAGGLVLEGGAGIGANGNAIETRLSDFGGAANTDGRAELSGGTAGVYLYNVDTTPGQGLTLGGIGSLANGVSATGGVEIYSGSPLTVNSAIVDAGGGQISLTASGAAPTDILTLNANVSTTGDADFTAGGAINQTGGNVTVNDLEFSAGGAVTLNSAGNNFNEIAGTSNGAMDLRDTDGLIIDAVGSQTGLTSTNNNIIIQTGDHFRTDEQVNAGTGDVTVTAGDRIHDGSVDDVADIIGANVSLTSNGEIGPAGNSYDVQSSTSLSANSSAGNDNIDIRHIGDAKVNNITAGTGNVTLLSTGNITDFNNDTNANITGTDVSLTATVGGIGSGANSLDTAAGTLTTNTSADNSNQFISEDNGLTELSLNAGTGDLTFVTVNVGDVLSADSAVDITASTANVTVANGAFGDTDTAAGNAIETSVATLNVDTTGGNGNQFIRETDNVAVGTINAGTGDVNLFAGGILSAVADDAVADILGATINLTATQIGASAVDVTATTALNADTSGSNGKIEIDSIGNLPLGTVNAGTGNVTIDSTGNITDVNDTTADAPAVTNVTGGTVNLIAAVGGIGTAGNAVDFLASTSFSADTNAGDDGNINVRSTGDAPIDLIDAGGGDVKLTSEGNITDFRNDELANVKGSTIDLLTTGAHNIGSPGNYFDIEPTTLWNLTMNGGTPYIHCIGDCPMGQVDIGTGIFFYQGNVTDGNDDLNGIYQGTPGDWGAATWNIRAGGAHLEGDDKIATSTDWLETELKDPLGVVGDGLLMANTSDPGATGIFVANAGTGGNGLQLGGIGGATLANALETAGSILINSFSPLTVAANVVAAANIGLHANGALATDDLTVNAGVNVQTTGANNTLDLTAGDSITVTAGATVQNSGAGQTNLLAGEDFTDTTVDQDGNAGGDVTVQDTATVTSATGKIVLDARDSVAVTGVSTGNTGDAINVTARTGSVTDGGDTNTDLTAGGATGRATINSAAGVGSGNALDTNIGQLDVTNTTSGNVQVDEIAAGGDLNIIRSAQQGSGSTTIQTLNGNLTVLAAGTGGLGVSATSGETTLDANGAGNDLNVQNTVTSTTGKINLDSEQQDVTFTADGDVTATGGAEIEVNASRNISMVDGTVLNANTGGTGAGSTGDVGVGIDLDAGTGNISLGSVQTTSTGSTSRGDANDAVSIVANNGAVTDAGDANAEIIANAGETEISAANGIGSGNSLEVQLDRVDATNSTANDIDLREEAAGGALNVVRIDQNAATGRIDVQTLDGTLTVLSEGVGGNAGDGVEGLAGEVFLIANGAGGDDDLVLNNQVESSTGKINLDSTSRDVVTDADGDVTATGGAEIESSAERNITMADGSVWNANGGGTGAGSTGDLGVGIDLDAANGDVTLGSVQTTSTGSTSRGDANDAVSINALNGAVNDGGDTTAEIIANAGETQINAANGIGSGNSLEVQLDRLDAVNSTLNDIDLREEAAGGALNIVRVDQNAPTGRIDVQTLDGTLTVLAEGVGGNPGDGVEGLGGEIFLRANGAGNDDDLVLNNQVESSTGKINLDSSSRDVIADAEGDATATGGAEIESDAERNITMADGTIWNANGAATQGIDLDARTGNVQLGSVQTTSTASDAVVISAQQGNVVDGGDTDQDIVSGAGTPGTAGTGGGILISASTGIGATGTGVGVSAPAAGNFFAPDALDVSGGRLAATTNTGDISIQNTGSLEITALTDNDGPTPQGAPSAGTVTGVTLRDGANANAGEHIFITSTGHMLVNSDVANSDAGDVTMYATGTSPMDIAANIGSEDGNGNVRVVSGGSMTQAAGSNIDTAGDGVTSGTGQVFVGAGYDAAGKTQAEPAVPGIDLFTSSDTLFDTVSDAGADFTMDETARITTEDGDILVDVQDVFTVGRVDADGNAGGLNTDGVRGDITTFSRNGSTLDAGAPTATDLDFLANELTMFSGNTVGVPNNPMETDAPIQNIFSINSQFVNAVGDTRVDLTSVANDIFFGASGNILVNRAHASGGETHLSAEESILALDGTDIRVIASNLVELIAGGVIGTASNPLQVQLNNPDSRQINLEARGAQNGLSINILSNVSAASINFLNSPLGLALFNGVVVGGQNADDLSGSLTSLFFSPVPVNNRAHQNFDGRQFANGFSTFFDFLEQFGYQPTDLVDSSALDVDPTAGVQVGTELDTFVDEDKDTPPTTVAIPEDATLEEPTTQQDVA